MATEQRQIVSRLPVRRRDRARVERGEVAFAPVDGALFAETPLWTDARQGVIGDCYLLSALSALARSAPDRLRALLVERPDGALQARFHRRLAGGGFVAEEVVIDRAVPVRRDDGIPIYARCERAAEAWPLLAEKAYAAWKGGWDVIGEGGMVEQTLEELTGEPTRQLFIAETPPEHLWRLLVRATREGWPAAVCTYGRHERPAIDELGFHPNHILVFLGVHEWMGRRIVWLRDPFDVPAAGSLVKPDPHGVYTLGWDEFVRYFAEVELNGKEACAVHLPPHPSQTISEAIGRSYVFHPLSAAARRKLAREFVRVRVEAGAHVAQAGEPADAFYIIQHGTAAIELPGERGRSQRVAVAHAGGAFGEIHSLDGLDYGATLRALTPMALYRLSADKLRHWVRRHPELGERFRRRFDLQLTMLEWGKHQLTTVDVDSLLRAGRTRRVRKGEIIFAPGDVADSVLLIADGTIDIEVKGKRGLRRARLTAGQVFGEVETLQRRLRLGTARAATAGSLLELDLGAAAEVMEQFDIVQRQLLAIAARREAARLGKRRHA